MEQVAPGLHSCLWRTRARRKASQLRAAGLKANGTDAAGSALVGRAPSVSPEHKSARQTLRMQVDKLFHLLHGQRDRVVKVMD